MLFDYLLFPIAYLTWQQPEKGAGDTSSNGTALPQCSRGMLYMNRRSVGDLPPDTQEWEQEAMVLTKG